MCVGSERFRPTKVAALFQCIAYAVREDSRVAQSKIEPLCTNRRQDVRSLPNEGHAVLAGRVSLEPRKRLEPACAHLFDGAK